MLPWLASRYVLMAFTLGSDHTEAPQNKSEHGSRLIPLAAMNKKCVLRSIITQLGFAKTNIDEWEPVVRISAGYVGLKDLEVRNQKSQSAKSMLETTECKIQVRLIVQLVQLKT